MERFNCPLLENGQIEHQTKDPGHVTLMTSIWDLSWVCLVSHQVVG